MSDRAVSSSSSASGGIGLFGMTFIALLVLKLTGHIDWSWWMVTAPLWGGFLFVVGMLILFGVIVGLVALFATFFENRKRATVRRHKEKMRQGRTYRP